jgi:uncharacterized paraquat-inducible protein A
VSTTTKAICHCNLCNQELEFDAKDAGATIACPHCGMETILYVVPAAVTPPLPSPSPKPAPKALLNCPACSGSVSPKAAVCPYCGEPLIKDDSASWGNIFAIVFKVLVALLVWSVPFGILLALLRFIFTN